MPRHADDVDHKLLDAVERLGRALRAARQHLATELGLTTLQIDVIERLDHLGSLPISRLARELDIAQPTASDAVATLERKQILERTRTSQDRRVTVASLTDTGESIAERIGDNLQALYPEPHGPPEPDRGIALHVLLQEILRLQRSGVITINRSCLSCHHYQPQTRDREARCLLLDTPLQPAQLRIDCPEHEPEHELDRQRTEQGPGSRAGG